MAKWIEVLIGNNFNESLIIWLFNPKLKFDPPTKIILGGATYFKSESFCFLPNSNEVVALGVAGNNIPTAIIATSIKLKIVRIDKSFFIAES